jgi:hypothetical protein
MDIGQMFGILKEEVFVSLKMFFALQSILLLLDLLFRPFKIVRARSRGRSILLLHIYPIQIGVLAQTEVELVKFTSLKVVTLVPRIFHGVVTGGRQRLYYLQVVVHIKSSTSKIVGILSSLLNILKGSISDLLTGVEVFSDGLVLSLVPRDVAMSIVAVDDLR